MHTIWATLARPIEAACRARTEATVSRHDARQKIRKIPSEFLTPSAGHDSGPRRAMAVVPRAQLASPPEAQTGEWHAVTLLDGSVVEACYQGNLGSPADLPPQGRFLGEEWSTGIEQNAIDWIWLKPVGSSFASWVDP